MYSSQIKSVKEAVCTEQVTSLTEYNNQNKIEVNDTYNKGILFLYRKLFLVHTFHFLVKNGCYYHC